MTAILTEILSGIATFFSMIYSLALIPIEMQGLNPTSHARSPALILATIFGSVFGTVLLAFWTNVPLALAPGIGLGSMFGSLIESPIGDVQFSYPNMLVVVFLAGLVFVIVFHYPCWKRFKFWRFYFSSKQDL